MSAITALESAALRKQWKAVARLAKGHPPESLNGHWLELVVRHNDAGSIIQLLHDFPDIIYVKDGLGRGFLHLICRPGMAGPVRHAIFLGANPNQRDRAGRTPLHVAALHGAAKEVSALLASGADPMIQSGAGETPSECARRMGNHLLASYIEQQSQEASESFELEAS